MKLKPRKWPNKLITNSLIFLASALLGVGPLLYLSFCYTFHTNPNPSLENLLGEISEITVFCVGAVALIAWMILALWDDKPVRTSDPVLILDSILRKKPERDLDVLQNVVVGCLTAFWFLASYYLLKLE